MKKCQKVQQSQCCSTVFIPIDTLFWCFDRRPTTTASSILHANFYEYFFLYAWLDISKKFPIDTVHENQSKSLIFTTVYFLEKKKCKVIWIFAPKINNIMQCNQRRFGAKIQKMNFKCCQNSKMRHFLWVSNTMKCFFCLHFVFVIW